MGSAHNLFNTPIKLSCLIRNRYKIMQKIPSIHNPWKPGRNWNLLSNGFSPKSGLDLFCLKRRPKRPSIILIHGWETKPILAPRNFSPSERFLPSPLICQALDARINPPLITLLTYAIAIMAVLKPSNPKRDPMGSSLVQSLPTASHSPTPKKSADWSLSAAAYYKQPEWVIGVSHWWRFPCWESGSIPIYEETLKPLLIHWNRYIVIGCPAQADQEFLFTGSPRVWTTDSAGIFFNPS